MMVFTMIAPISVAGQIPTVQSPESGGKQNADDIPIPLEQSGHPARLA
jgi:hypothetical protein